MTKITLCAIMSMSALGACDRKPETSAEQRASAQDAAVSSPRDEESANVNLNAEGAAAPDATVLQKATAKLDLQDAEAKFLAAPKIKLKGAARLNQRDDGVHIDVELSEGPPGTHGVHIHQKADCSDIPGKSMGEHFAPAGNPHGLPGQPAHHLGDMGNVNVDAQGKGELEIELKDAKLDDGPTSLLGKALVLHEKEDIGAQPSGDSGTPIGCAVIQRE